MRVAQAVWVPLALAGVTHAAGPASPLRSGFYARAGTSCAAALRAADGVVVRGASFIFSDGSRDATVIAKTAPTTYRFTFVIEDGAGKKSRLITTVVLSATGFSEQTPNQLDRWTFCTATAPRNWGL